MVTITLVLNLKVLSNLWQNKDGITPVSYTHLGILLDRMSLSIKNKWLDEENKVYIIYTIEEIMEVLNWGLSLIHI